MLKVVLVSMIFSFHGQFIERIDLVEPDMATCQLHLHQKWFTDYEPRGFKLMACEYQWEV